MILTRSSKMIAAFVNETCEMGVKLDEKSALRPVNHDAFQDCVERIDKERRRCHGARFSGH
jgi:hypothetical protein